MAKLEHVNITVSDVDRSAALYGALFDWTIRWRGGSQMGGETIHLGNDDQYMALYSAPDHDRGRPYGFGKGTPLNHVGILVDDLDAVEQRVIDAGLTPFSHGNYEPGRRFYFFDPDGVEVEVISYDNA